jgi:hypothetical protein
VVKKTGLKQADFDEMAGAVINHGPAFFVVDQGIKIVAYLPAQELITRPAKIESMIFISSRGTCGGDILVLVDVGVRCYRRARG